MASKVSLRVRKDGLTFSFSFILRNGVYILRLPKAFDGYRQAMWQANDYFTGF